MNLGRTLLAGLAIGLAIGPAALPARADTRAAAAVPVPGTGGAAITVATSATRPRIPGLDRDQCFEVGEIVVTGIQLVPTEAVAGAVRPLAFRCVGNVLARAVIAAINEVHAGRGFVTTQGYVRAQDIRGTKRLVIHVITGRIGRIVTREHNDDETPGAAFERTRNATGPWAFLSGLSGLFGSLALPLNRLQLVSPEAFPDLKTRLAMPAEAGDALDLNRIQQGIDQLNRSPSQRASARLVPGAEPGTSDVLVDLPRVRSFRLTAGYESNGGALNGPQTIANRFRVDVAKDNLFGFNDNWATSFASGIQSNEIRTSLVVPLRWLTLAVNAGYSEYLTVLAPNVGLLQQIATVGASASYVVARDRSQQTRIDASFQVRDVVRFVNVFKLDPQNVSVARIGGSQTLYFENAQVTYGVGYSRGLPVFGATRHRPGAGPATPSGEFQKFDVSFSYQQLFKPYGIVKLDLIGQYSPTTLFQEDRLAFGSVSTVRGFARAPAFADSGVYARTEFAALEPVGVLMGLPGNGQEFYQEALNGLRPYLFADGGVGRNIANAETVARASLGAGLRYSLGRFAMDWSVARPVLWRGLIPGSRPAALESYLTLTVTLF